MNIDKIYELRKNFTIIALTGRTGSGCTEVSNRLKEGFSLDNSIFKHPDTTSISHNSYRKYRIVYNYAKENFKKHIHISYKNVLLIFVLQRNFECFTEFTANRYLEAEFKRTGLDELVDFSQEVKELRKLEHRFDELHQNVFDIFELKKDKYVQLKDFFCSPKFIEFAEEFNECLQSMSKTKRNKLLQVIGNNIRMTGDYLNFNDKNLNSLFTIADLMNNIIKEFHKENKKAEHSTEIVIDSLRNPLEIMFFRQRFSAFYTIAINRDERYRIKEIEKRYKADELGFIERLMNEEYKPKHSKEFYRQNVSACIQNADIHLSFKTYEEIDFLNEKYKNENHSPYFSWQMQLLKFISLIDQPGIVTPSPEERCMQLAFTAKYNSGCISRQVGAAVTDANYSIKAIGWNNTPEGQVPCNLRNANDLLEKKNDIEAFTPYEIDNPKFQAALNKSLTSQIAQHGQNLNGRNVCFCFKTLINSYSEGKNQVHTRSLHAEESAFLQISKYGGQGIQGGRLFTTASPCELCSKKAYQLGIKTIYYIDPYPGISQEQILKAGAAKPTMRLFHGAIGNAYHWLYEPFMSYKDELSLILEQDIKDLTTLREDELEKTRLELAEKDNELEELRAELQRLKK
ncbi:hypothetical protein [Flavobacterium sp.]|uniref:hypothetical protein n=1 Tax=Flavobacterium sp. TaxID=239 RepID=UPI0039E292C6